MIHVYINRKKATLIVDTGASRTVFDKTRIKEFTGDEEIKKNDKRSTGVGTNNIISHETTIKAFRLGKLTIKNYVTVLLDLSHVNESYKTLGLPSIDGVLGSDILFTHQAVVDYHKHELHLSWEDEKKVRR
jgi:predicted aspartyl protease